MSKKPVFILGLAYFGQHDSGVALIKDGKLLVMSEEERWSRIKYDRSFPEQSIKFCLDYTGITIDKIDHVAFFWQPWRGIISRIYYAFMGLPKSLTGGSKNSGILFDLFSAKKIFRQNTGYKGPFYFLDHHSTHVASAFFSSNFETSAVISIDGTGETETSWLGIANSEKFTKYHGTRWPHSLGHTYSSITQYLGFKPFGDEYKVMGLSSFGKPRYLPEFRKIIKSTGDGSFEIDLSYMDYQHSRERRYSDKFIETFGPNRLPGESLTKKHKDIASSLQVRIEEVLTELVSYIIKKSGSEFLCLSGGVTLNSLAIGNLRKSGIVKNIYVSPVSSDTGTALGSAYYVNNIILKNKERYPLEHAYWGSLYTNSEIETVLKKYKLVYKKIDNPAKEGAELLSNGQIIGWFQGRAEIGQRALGNRSILADPRDKNTKDRLNSKIKNRESFRPFAPAILEKFQRDYFDSEIPIPFMTEVHTVKEKKRKIIPAVVHVDGTGRLQTVDSKTNTLFHELISKFQEITGIPVVLNTSFNINGEPIVNSPDDAVKTFLTSGLDALIIGNFLIIK